jgi:hypothetical protein
MNEILIRFEKVTGLGPTYAARLLGVAYVTYAQYRNLSRPLQLYHARHVEALLSLPKPQLTKLIERHAHGATR